jgi:hypothetical protein
MLNKATTLKDYTLHSSDGEIGKVKEFYFDDRHWAIRYLVVDTGNWLAGRKVLISPHALAAVNSEEQYITVQLTKKQIEDSPSLDSDKPVSRQFEESYHKYYRWPAYWGGLNMWGSYSYPQIMGSASYPQIMGDPMQGQSSALGGNPSTMLDPMQGKDSAQGPSPYTVGTLPGMAAPPEEGQAAEEAGETWDPDLRSTHDVSGHNIHAADGEVGHVEDFVIYDETWASRYLIVDTKNWWPGKKVLISPQWIDRVSWEEQAVFVTVLREAIKQSPEYTEESLITREYEIRLHGHYNLEGYWVDEAAANEQPK